MAAQDGTRETRTEPDMSRPDRERRLYIRRPERSSMGDVRGLDDLSRTDDPGGSMPSHAFRSAALAAATAVFLVITVQPPVQAQSGAALCGRKRRAERRVSPVRRAARAS